MANNTKRPSDMLLLIGIWIVFSSWLLFQTPLPTNLTLLLVAASGVILLLYGVFRMLLRHSGWILRRSGILLICLAAVLLTLIPPLYSWYSSTQRLNRMFAALNIQGTREKVDVYLLDSIGDVMEHSKGVVGTYQLSMPIGEAERKIVSVLKPLPGWDVVTNPTEEDFVMYADCGTTSAPDAALSLRANGILVLWISRFAPDRCLLK